MHRILSKALLLALCAGGMAGQGGCGGDEKDVLPGPFVDGVPRPKIMAISPTQLAAGERMQILGNGFCAPGAQCRTRITFEGAYQTASGTNPVQLEAQNLEVVNQGTMAWTFAPNIPFSTRGEPGVYSGNVRVFNEALDGQGGVPSEPLTVQLSVGPSIIARQLGPLSGACGSIGGVTETLEGTPFVFEMEAVGLQPATPGSPILFGYTFLKENFQFEGRFADRYETDPKAILPESGPVSLVMQIQEGLVSSLGGNQLRNVAVVRQAIGSGGNTNSGSALFDWMLTMVPTFNANDAFAINGIRTAPIPNAQASQYRATIAVVAVDRNGTMAHRTFPVTVWTPIEVADDGSTKAVQAFAPEPVSGCVPGQAPPVDLSYTEQSSETRSRALNTTLISKPLAGASLMALTAKIEAELGIRVDDSVSSSELRGQALSVQVLPGEFGAVYRQTIQIERQVRIREHGLCGESTDLGYAIITDWRWSPELAKRKQASCPPYPPSKLSAQRF